MLSFLIGLTLAMTGTAPDAPKLTVIISIDQFRSDYVTRFADLYLPARTKDGPGGFRWLTETGANFANAHYNHVPTETGPGHAVIGTGSNPGLNGIVGNSWYDRKLGKTVYCVADPDSKDVATGLASASPRTLQVTTFGDELKRATGGFSKNISISLKDRASILMAGHLADGVVWFDVKSGNWTSSDYYCKNGKLPAWAAKVNAAKLPDAYKGKSWTASLPAAALNRASIPDKPGITEPYGEKFPHRMGDGESFYANFTKTPFANDYVFTTAETAITEAGLGHDDVPDLLTINLASNDYVGHAFGPDSPEVMEMAVATDSELSAFFKFLDKKVGLDNVLIVVTADHGVMPMAEELTKRGLPGGRINAKQLLSEMKKAVQDEFNGDKLVVDMSDYMIYFDEAALPKGEATIDDVAMFVRDWLRAKPAFYGAFTRWELNEQALPNTEVTAMLSRSYNRQNSGDVFFFLKPGYILDSYGTGTGHGSPWSYDRDVPLLMRGKWLNPGKHLDDCGPEDIAPTVCSILGIGRPSGCVGRAVGLKSK